ncbi:MAG: T9SS C-terminal target domain-containing protein [Bacteroidetes bacterium]|nr:MAG: T9SS C-terminal target domain-containing protein [Bacteroidota bacterium]
MKEKKLTLFFTFMLIFGFLWNLNAQMFEMNTTKLGTYDPKKYFNHDEDHPFNDPENVKLFLQQFERGGEKIVGGEDVDIEDYPWQVSLQLQPQFGGAHFCGGTIIGDRWILTASHCLFFGETEVQPFQIRIRAGFTAMNTTEGSFYNISDIIVHPDYGTTNNEHQFDIALLRLSNNIDFDHPGKASVNIVTQGDASNGLTDPGVMAKVSGWGALSFGGPSPNILQAVEVPIVGGSASYPPAWITSDMILAGASGQDACQGDSGGPLVVPDDNGWYKVAGVVSWGVDCGAPGYPGVYARVSYFEEWLNEYIVFPDPNQFYTFHYEDFGGGEIPDGWVNNVIEGPANFPGWEWTITGGAYGGQLNSTTATNGYMILDSDAHGINGVPEEADLITPAFDFTGIDTEIRFTVEHLARTFGAADVRIYVSTDDFASQTELYRWHGAPQNDFNGPNPLNSSFDVTEIAQGQPNVKFKFKWIGSYDYWWLVDDVKILVENEPVDVQFVVTANGQPLEDVHIFTQYTNQEVYTDAQGIAHINLYEGDYDISAIREGFFNYQSTITVSGESMVVEIEMEKIPAPEIEVDITSIEIEVPQGYTGTSMLNISNPGDAELEFALFAYPAGSAKEQTVNLRPVAHYEGFDSGSKSDLQVVQLQKPIDAFDTGEKFDEFVEIHYDNGIINNAIGTGGAISFITAVRFTPEELAAYYGAYEWSKVKFHISGEQYNSVVLKVWEGGSDEGPGTEIYSEEVLSQVIPDDWATFDLSEKIPMTPGVEYWMGYSVNATGGFPASVDTGPMEPEKGAWMFIGGSWSLLPDVNSTLDFNWAIRGILELVEQIEWIGFNPQSGTVEPEQNVDVVLTFDATNLELGDYNAEIVVQNNAGESISIPVLLTVVPPVYDVTFDIVDQDGDAVEEAVVTLDGITNAAGDYVFENVLAGTYAYEVVKEGYLTAQGSVLVSDNITVEVVLVSEDTDILTLTVILEDEFDQPVEGAYFTIQGFGGHLTDENGEVVINIIPGTFSYAVSKTGFEPLAGSVTLTDDAEQTLEITLTYLRFDVVLDVNIEGAGDVIGAGEYYYGETVTVEAIPNTGYHFVHWLEEQIIVSTDAEYSFEVTVDRNLMAVFALNTYTITATSGPNGGINPEGEIEVTHGDDLTFEITPAPGYHIDDVLVNGESAGAVSTYTFENIAEDGTIHAEFAINIYQVTVTSEGNGTVSPDGVIDAPHGSSLTFELTPDEGNFIADILVNGQSVGAQSSYLLANITSNTTFHAVFELEVSVPIIEALADLKVYPNPAQDLVTIESNEIITEVRLLNISGQLLKTLEVQDVQVNLKLNDLPAGIYILRIESENGIKAVSLAIQ